MANASSDSGAFPSERPFAASPASTARRWGRRRGGARARWVVPRRWRTSAERAHQTRGFAADDVSRTSPKNASTTDRCVASETSSAATRVFPVAASTTAMPESPSISTAYRTMLGSVMSWWNRCWRTGRGDGEVSAGARGEGAKGGKLTKRARFGFFAAPCCCDGPVLPFARGEYLAGVRLVVVAAVAARPELHECSRASAARTPRRAAWRTRATPLRDPAIRPRAPLSGYVAMLRTRPTRRMWRNPPSEASRPDLSSLEASRLPPATAAARAAIAARAAARTMLAPKPFGASRGIRDDWTALRSPTGPALRGSPCGRGRA